MAEKPKLLPCPCPFCGTAPEIYPKDPSREGDAFGQVRCENDDCPAQPVVNDGIDINDTRGSDAYKAAAIAAWNRRSPLPEGSSAAPPPIPSTAEASAALAERLKMRLDRAVERDGSVEAAIKGPGVTMGYLLALDIHRALASTAEAPAASGWRTITDADVGKTMLVTNNIKARNAFGEMSHKWITWIQVASDPDTTGKYVGYDCGDRLIHNLTHCAPIPAPEQEGASHTEEQGRSEAKPNERTPSETR